MHFEGEAFGMELNALRTLSGIISKQREFIETEPRAWPSLYERSAQLGGIKPRDGKKESLNNTMCGQYFSGYSQHRASAVVQLYSTSPVHDSTFFHLVLMPAVHSN